MIVVQASDPSLRRAVLKAAHPEEDVVADHRLAVEALDRGFPRLVVRDGTCRRRAAPPGTAVVVIDETMLAQWEAQRRAAELPPTRVDHLADRVSSMVQRSALERTHVDTALADLSRAVGRRLPHTLRCFGRRVLEFPSHYTSLHPLAHACGTTRGALKARFRRRGLPSPAVYLRWFRVMAASELLSDRQVTVAQAARRLGFTSDGNMCRMMWSVAGMTPTEARTLRGWNRILISFAWTHLTSPSLEGWATLDDLFERRIA